MPPGAGRGVKDAPRPADEAGRGPWDTLGTPFGRWQTVGLDELGRVEDLLETPLSDNPAQLQAHARELASWYGRCTTILAHANAMLDLAIKAELAPKGEGRTDLDRKSDLDAAVAEQRDLRDRVKGSVEGISLTVSLAQTIIKANSAEGRHSGVA